MSFISINANKISLVVNLCSSHDMTIRLARLVAVALSVLGKLLLL